MDETTVFVDNSNVGERENDIEKEMSIFPHLDRLKNVPVLPIPYHNDIICRVELSIPLAFSLSTYYDCHYFEMVIISTDEEKGVVLNYQNKYGDPAQLPYRHSGDVYCGSDNLLQSMLPIDNWKEKGSFKGVLAVQGYDKKSFRQLKHCQPSICLVDGCETIYLIHFPLSEDFVGDSSIAYIAHFTYNPKWGVVTWSIPKIPTFSIEKFNINDAKYENYFENGLREFNINHHSRIDATINDVVFADDDDDYEMLFSDNEKSPSVLIIQEPLLGKYSKVIQEFTRGYDDDDIFTFHQRIKRFVTASNNEADEHQQQQQQWCSNYNYSLPQASCYRYYDELRLRKLLRKNAAAVVIVSDLYPNSLSCLLQVGYRLNGTFVIISSKIDVSGGKNNIEKALNSVNTSMVVSLCGPLSTIIVCLPQCGFFYYKGTFNDKKFGDRVTPSEIITMTNEEKLKDVAAHIVNDDYNRIYSHLGCIVTTLVGDSINEKDLLLDIFRCLKHDNMNFNNKKRALSYICNQLEYIIDCRNLKRMIELMCHDNDILKENIVANQQQLQQLSKMQCLEWVGNFLNIQTDKQEQRDEPASLDFLLKTYVDLKGIGNTVRIDPQQTPELMYLFNTYNTFMEASKRFVSDWVIVYTAINGLIPMKDSCVVSRNRGESKSFSYTNAIINEDVNDTFSRQHKNCDDKAWMEVICNGCTRQGILFLRLDWDKLLLQLKSGQTPDETDASMCSISPNYRVLNLNGYMGASLIRGQYLIYQGENETIISIPILDELLSIMEIDDGKILENNWTGDLQSTVRMKLRHSIHSMLPQNLRERYNPGSAYVSKLALYLLSCAIKYVISTFGHVRGEDISNIVKGLLGLMFSIMGAVEKYSQAYKVALRENNNKEFRINFEQNKMWLQTICEAWHFTNSKIDVRENIKSYLRANIIGGAIMEYINKRMKKYKKAGISHEYNRAARLIWLNRVASPIVWEILLKQNPENYENASDDEKMAILSNIIKSKGSTRKLRADKMGNDDVNFTVDRIRLVLLAKFFRDNNFKDNNNSNSHLYREMKTLCEEIINRDNDDITWWKYRQRLESIAADYAARYSSFLKPEWNSMVEYIMNNVSVISTKGIEKKLFEFIHSGKREISNEKLKHYQYGSSAAGNEADLLLRLRKMKMSVIEAALRYRNPKYTYTPYSNACKQLLLALIDSQTIEHYVVICLEYKDLFKSHYPLDPDFDWIKAADELEKNSCVSKYDEEDIINHALSNEKIQNVLVWLNKMGMELNVTECKNIMYDKAIDNGMLRIW